MCRVDNCERHEFDHGYCLPHLKEARSEAQNAPVKAQQNKSGTRRRNKKIDALEVVTADAAVEEKRSQSVDD